MQNNPQNETGRVTVNLTVEDIENWMYCRVWLSPLAGLRYTLRTLCVAGVLFCLFALVAGGFTLLNLGLAAGFALVTVPWKELFGWKGEARKYARRSPGALQPMSYLALPEGLLHAYPSGQTLRPWNSFSELIGADRSLFFNTKTGVSVIIPRRFFASPAASQQFLEQCRTLAAAAGGPTET